jgi:hypothetical protein
LSRPQNLKEAHVKRNDDLNAILSGTPKYPPPRPLPEDINVMKHRWAAKAGDGLQTVGSGGRRLVVLSIEILVILAVVGLVILGLKQLS